MTNKRWLAALLLLIPMGAAAEVTPGENVAQLFDAGDYANARGLSTRLIEDYEAGLIVLPAAEAASVYVMAACLADLFHDPGFVEEVDRLAARAVALDPNADAGPANDRPLVRDSLARARASLLAAQGPAARRFSAGPVLSITGPGALQWPDTILPGIRLGYAPVPWLDVEGEAAITPGGSPSLGVELRLGAAIRPFFDLRRPLPVVVASYVASSGTTWAHGLALSAGVEVALPQGLWLRGTAELLRIDLGPAPASGGYPTIGGAVFSFPRLSLSFASAP